MDSEGKRKPSIGFALFVIWLVLFLGGAVGEIFEVGFLRDATQLPSLFLR